jgi:hypothetical protein
MLLSVASIVCARCDMDIELTRTFLVIISTGRFIKAAGRLHAAQTTATPCDSLRNS